MSWNGTLVKGCPDCSGWTGTMEKVCGHDGVTYSSKCELFIALCSQTIVSVDSNVEINTIAHFVNMATQQYIANVGDCNSGGGGGHCPQDSGCAASSGSPICDSSLTEYGNSCELVKKLCGEGILSFDDSVTFNTMTDDEFFGHVKSWVQWHGPCNGPCGAGMMSSTGSYPCVDCGLGTYQGAIGQTSCISCPKGSYQSASGATSCVTCPDSKTTTHIGSSTDGDCKLGCQPGSSSDTGLEPCQACPVGFYQNTPGASSCTKCSPGSYSASIGTSSCDVCPAGKYSGASGSTGCTDCLAGTAATKTFSDTCKRCSPGTYSTNSGATLCDLCPKGSYSDGQENTSCKDCDAGFYTNEDGSDACEQCPIGTVAATTGAVSCTKCPAGTYSATAGNQQCSPCSNGHVSGAGAGSCTACPIGTKSSNNQCVSCSANTYSAGATDTCTPCPGDQVAPIGSSSCIECSKGSYVNPAGNCDKCSPGFFSNTIGASACTECSEGTFSALMGSTVCHPCGIGHFSNSLGATSCTMCHPGSYNNQPRQKECTLCPVGKFAPGSGSMACLSCMPGTFANETGMSMCIPCPTAHYQDSSGQDRCEQCPAGQYNDQSGQYSCKSCSPGTHSPLPESETCTSCRKGEYAVSSGQTTCDICPVGTYNMHEKQNHCTQCPPGTFADSKGSHVCMKCPKGHANTPATGVSCTTCPKGQYASDQGSHHCNNCLAGFFADEEGSAMCEPCDPGTFSSQSGQETCFQCPAGTLAAGEGNSFCTSCSPGYFSVAGAASCSSCPPGQFTDQTGAQSCRSCPLGHYSAVSGSPRCDACDVGEYGDEIGATECKTCPAGQYSDSTGCTLCKSCSRGYYSTAGLCTKCPTGQFSDQEGASSCSKCGAGTFSSSTGSTSCLTCDAGTFSSAGATSCSPCAAGSHSTSSGSGTCAPCPYGTFKQQSGSSQCQPCSVGSANYQIRQTVCTKCEVGFIAATTGLKYCTACPAGNFAPVVGSVNCILCPKGQYSNSIGQQSCKNCQSGEAASYEGMASCEVCEAGSYSVGNRNEVCTECPAGHFSNTRKSSSCTACPAGHYAPYKGSIQCLPCPVGYYSTSPGSPTCQLCVNSINQDVGQTTCVPCKPGTRPNSDSTECDLFNIVQGKPTYQSTTISNVNGGSGNAADGITNTDYNIGSCTMTASENSPWWKVDLGGRYRIQEIVIYNRADCCSDRIDGFMVHVGSTGTSNDPVCGDPLNSSGFIHGSKHIKCRPAAGSAGGTGGWRYASFISIHHPSRPSAKVLSVCEVKAYTEMLDRSCPNGFYSATGLRPCEPCRAGYYVSNGKCLECPRGTYSVQDQATKCMDCPFGHTTYRPHTDRCYGPSIQTSYSGTNYIRYTRMPELGSPIGGKTLGWTSTLGLWETYQNQYYKTLIRTLSPSNGLAVISIKSMKPVLTNYFCYTPRDFGAGYMGWRATTRRGESCKRWDGLGFADLTGHNYCRNPTRSGGGPWCYKDTSPGWDYCDIPKCVHDVDCYTKEGLDYYGYVERTEDGKLCDQWPSSNNRRCKNIVSSNMPKPWCYVSGVKKLCAVDKCQRDCGDPTSGMWGRFQAKETGKCWDVKGYGTTVRERKSNLQMYNCELPHLDATDHIFKMDSQGFIINKHSGLCVNLWGDRDPALRVNYNMWTCQHNSHTDQTFHVEWHPRDSCAFRLRNIATNMCIDAEGHAIKEDSINVQQFTCRDDDWDDHWYYFLPATDRVCTYQFRPTQWVTGTTPLKMGSFSTLAGAQSTCSRLGDQCGGVYNDKRVVDRKTGKFFLRTGKTTHFQVGYQSWLKMDCEDAKFDYFEQKFND